MRLSMEAGAQRTPSMYPTRAGVVAISVPPGQKWTLDALSQKLNLKEAHVKVLTFNIMVK